MIADIIAEDRDGHPILLVEVKADEVTERVVHGFLGAMVAAPESIAFGMLVDPETIRVYRRGNPSPILRLDAIEVLRHYSPAYGAELIRDKPPRLLGIHVATLVEAWLRDLSHRWKSDEVPRSDELERIGLLPLLRDSSIGVEVPLIGHAVR